MSITAEADAEIRPQPGQHIPKWRPVFQVGQLARSTSTKETCDDALLVVGTG
jgi:hypothetical protein